MHCPYPSSPIGSEKLLHSWGCATQAQLVKTKLISGEQLCAEICILHCESKPFLQGCFANNHSMRCTKSHVLQESELPSGSDVDEHSANCVSSTMTIWAYL